MMGIGVGIGVAHNYTAPIKTGWGFNNVPDAMRIGLWSMENAEHVNGRIVTVRDQWNKVDMSAQSESTAPSLGMTNGRAVASWPDSTNNLALTPSTSIAPAHWFIVGSFMNGTATSWPQGSYPNLISTGRTGNAASGLRVMGSINGPNWFDTDVWASEAAINAQPPGKQALPLPLSLIEVRGTPIQGTWSLGLASGSTGRGWRGTMMMALALTEVVSGDLQARIQGRICWDCGIQSNLPTTHPYRSMPPS